MAETGPRPEIEDVLASIRRLVSQDSPQATETYRTAPMPEPDPLVLTPAHMIRPEPEMPEEDVPEARFWSDESGEVADSLEDPSGAHLADMTGEPAPEAPDNVTEISAARRAPQNFEPEFEDDASVHWPDATELPKATLGDELNRLETTLASLEAEVSRKGLEFEPEQGDRFEPEGTHPLTQLPDAYETEALDIPQHEADEQDDAALTVDADEADVAQDVPEPLELGAEFEVSEGDWPEDPDQTAALDEMLDVDPPPPAPEPERVVPRRLHLSDAERRRPAPEARPSSYEGLRERLEAYEPDDGLAGEMLEAEEGELAPPVEAGLHPIALAMDEGQLRQFVSEVLREELRGSLGTRMTRNLRKMIRREVQRALMARDFD